LFSSSNKYIIKEEEEEYNEAGLVDGREIGELLIRNDVVKERFDEFPFL
jgi:hypothetical protein